MVKKDRRSKEMFIQYIELLTTNVRSQHDFYSEILDLPVKSSIGKLEVQAGTTTLVFDQAQPDFDSAYHFAFNIPENQLPAAMQWSSGRFNLLNDETGKKLFVSNNWNSHSVYFKDPEGNVLEFIARHDMKNAVTDKFDSKQILNVSEIGLPSENVIELANELCTQLGLSVFHQEPNESFTPVGDDNGLFILPIKDRIWIPQSGVLAKLLPVKVKGNTNSKEWEVHGVPYEISHT
jgi:catechol-2,3-dioxygenase